MRTSLKSAASVILAAFATLALTWPGPARAEPEAAGLVDAVTGLNTLRDQLADNWSLTMKYGWEATLVLDEEYGGEVKIKNTEENAARLETLLKSAPAEDRAKADRLVQTLAHIRLAEKNYMESINRVRNSAAHSLLAQISIAEMSWNLTPKIDALFFGSQPVEYGRAEPLPVLEERFGFKPQPMVSLKDEMDRRGVKPPPPESLPVKAEGPPEVKLKSLAETTAPEKTEPPAPNSEARSDADELVVMFEEMQTPPADSPGSPLPLEELSPSDDLETLRTAYAAYKAYQSIRNESQMVSSTLQMAMYDANPAHFYYRPDLMSLEASLNSIRRLPGLPEGQLKSLGQLPSFFQETLDNITAFDENLKRKKTAQDNLEKLVGSALAQIDEMRSDYLNRLRGESQ